MYLHPKTYTPVKVQKAEKLGLITYINGIADPLHFGYWGGLPTKIIWFFGGLSITGLMLTGIWIALKRRVKKDKKQFGIWKYLKLLVFRCVTLFMFGFLVIRYAASWQMMLWVGLVYGLFIFLGWYVFVNLKR